MGTTKRHQSKRNNNRQTAVSFLSNITLGNEHEIKRSLNTTTSPTTPTVESPIAITATHHDSITNKPSITRYGTLSISNDMTIKGNIAEPTTIIDSNLISEESVQNNNLTIDTSLSNNDSKSEPLSLSNSLHTTTPTEKRRLRRASTSDSFNTRNHRRFSSGSSSTSSEVVHQYKLTREDSQRPIASEKVKKRPEQHHHHHEKNSETGSAGFMSVFRYYKGIIRQPRRRSDNPYFNNGHNHHIYYHSYFQQHASNLHLKHRKALSYGHFLLSPQQQQQQQSDQIVPNISTSSSDDGGTSTPIILDMPTPLVIPIPNYDPNYLNEDDNTTQNTMLDMNNSRKKKELNELFRKNHPEINAEITLSKIIAIKSHLLNIGKSLDLEISSISHAFVYFEKLIQKQIVNKQNRKILAACCLFLATKVNEPKGSWFNPLLEAIHSELSISSKDVLDHEFAVFADLEFNLYVPLHEFMPHFDKIFNTLDYKCIEDYIGNELFYKAMDGGHEIVGTASSASPISPSSS